MRRKHIALALLATTLLFFLIKHSASSAVFNPNEKVAGYFEYALLCVQIIFTIVVYKSPKNDTKNICTALVALITFLYFGWFIYYLIM